MSPLHQRTTDSLQSAPLSLKPGWTLVDNLWTLMDNWWTGDGCHPFHIRFLFLQYVNVNLNFIDGQYTRGKATRIFHDNETLPKAQRTRGLSSYRKITVHSSQILNILQFQNLDSALTSKSQPNISISTKI